MGRTGSSAQKFGAKNVESLVVWLDICTVDAVDVAVSFDVLDSDSDADADVGALPTTGENFQTVEKVSESENERVSVYGSHGVSFTEGGSCYV